MDKITISEITKAVKGTLISDIEDQWITGISTDSRTVESGELFIPITGEVHDAHMFIPQVIKRGCRAILVSDLSFAKEETDCAVILVENTTEAIQELSRWYLERLQLSKIAVTGSVGKTSTRDMVYYVLREKYITGKAEKNFNNEIGVPLTIFSFDQSMEAAVLEVGMDHSGEIHRLVDIIRPEIGIITNVGISHIENLGSREGILAAKLEITDYFGEENTLIINNADDMLGKVDYGEDYQLIVVGNNEEDGYYVHDIDDHGEAGINYTLTTEGRDYPVALGIPGAHNAINSALALAAGRVKGVSIETGIKGLSKIQLTGMRLTVTEVSGIKIIDDTYNAAPDSMKSAINTLINTKGKRKILILSGMNELGSGWKEYHRDVGVYAAEKEVDLLITVGEKGRQISLGFERVLKNDKVRHFDDKEQLYCNMNGMFAKGDVILVKGSRTMEMEQVVDRIINEQE